eukprot:6483944-Amphidinium_carterae.1
MQYLLLVREGPTNVSKKGGTQLLGHGTGNQAGRATTTIQGPKRMKRCRRVPWREMTGRKPKNKANKGSAGN